MKSESNDEDKQSLYDLKLDLERVNNDLQSSSNLEDQKYLLVMKKYLLQAIAEKYQESCNHPVWYMIYEDEQIDNRSILTCQCLECNLIEKGLKSQFNGKILTGQDILKKLPGLTHVYEKKKGTTNKTRIFKKYNK